MIPIQIQLQSPISITPVVQAVAPVTDEAAKNAEIQATKNEGDLVSMTIK